MLNVSTAVDNCVLDNYISERRSDPSVLVGKVSSTENGNINMGVPMNEMCVKKVMKSLKSIVN